METDWEEMQPFWVQSATNNRHSDRYRRRIYSFLFNSALVVIIVLVTAVCFRLFIVPSVVSVSSQILRPNNVKKSWDSINVLLVIFALIFGFLSRDRNEESLTSDEYRPNPVSPTISDQTYSGGNGRRMGGLRSSSSYPDLRESPPWIPSHSRWRSFDDTESSRVPVNDRRRRSWGDIEGEDLVTKNVVHVHVDTEVTHHHLEPISDTPPPPAESPPPPPDTLSGHHHLEQIPDTPPPPPPPVKHGKEKSIKSEKKRRGGANANIGFHNKSLKKRRQRQRSVDNFDTLIHQSQPASVHYLRPPPSPPPPPPPPPSVFHNLFSSKKIKRRNIYIPSIPPPPPRNRLHEAPWTKTSNFSISSVEETSSSGGESPLYGIPPPPPFKMRDWEFAGHSDFVKIRSNHSSRSRFPDLDDPLESPQSDNSPTVFNGSETTASPLFCPSPDVNTKADTFIANFKAGLRLEKMDSFNKKQSLRMSNLGPGPSQN